jgi:hypothetical protein
MSSVTAAKTPKRRASGLLRDDEQFVIVAVSKAFSAPWRLGKNPPDAYLDLTFGTVAVEISTLVQPITSANETLPKKSVERPILDIGEELNHILQGLIPDGYRVSVHFLPPLREAAKTKRKIASVIRSFLRDIRTFPRHHYLQVHNNPISIYLDYQIDPHAKKVTIGFIQKLADVGENTQHTLKDRIKVKAYKCRNLIGRGPLWLALLNDYCLTDADTYRYAFSRMTVQHPFDKILIVGGDASVAEIFGS